MIAALQNGGPDDFTNYTRRLEAAWGREYRMGRFGHKLAGIPAIPNTGIKLLDNGLVRDATLRVMYGKSHGPLHTY